MTDPRYWLWLSLSFSPGSAQCDLLLRSFNGNPKAIYDASPEVLRDICSDNQSLKALEANRDMNNVEAVIDKCEKENVGILTQASRYYPKSLLRITGSPPVIYYKGRLPDFSSRLTIAVVGTRDVTEYGKYSSYTISHDLAYSGAIIVSGMAKGSDTYAHRGALDAHGHTVAFLGCGIDVVYPKENASLMNEIIAKGTVMTDFAPGQRPDGWHFPIRNRLISGLSHGVLVTEASAKSGALITASYAQKQGKLLYAIPGKLGELASVGTNELIINGAKMITGAADIISDFKGLFSELKQPPQYLSQQKTNRNFLNRKYDRDQNNGNYDNIITNQTTLQAAQPLPKIIFDDKKEPDNSRRAMPENKNDVKSIEQDSIYAAVPGLKYPSEIPPDTGYEVNLSKEKADYYATIANTSYHRRFEPNSEFTASASSHGASENTIESQSDMPKIRHSERSNQPKAFLPDLTGLSENEAAILKFISQNGKSLADDMLPLKISISDILASLTVLEVKKRIVRLPGGYFDLIKE